MGDLAFPALAGQTRNVTTFNDLVTTTGGNPTFDSITLAASYTLTGNGVTLANPAGNGSVIVRGASPARSWRWACSWPWPAAAGRRGRSAERGAGVLTWVVYDTTKGRTRMKVPKWRLDFGLYRVQENVYLGNLTPSRVDVVLQFSCDLLDLETGRAARLPDVQGGLRPDARHRPGVQPSAGCTRGADQDDMRGRSCSEQCGNWLSRPSGSD